MNKIITMLEELKINYSLQLFKDTLEELNITQLNSITRNIEEFSNAINGQKDEFYDEIAQIFKEDFEINPMLYLIVWEELITSFNQTTLDYFYHSCKSIDSNTDFTDLINGLIELNKDNYDLAILHFNRIDDEIAYYFLGICYFELENDENTIKQYLLFIDHLNYLINNINDEEFDTKSFDIIFWNLYNDLAYSYIKLFEFNNALEMFNNGLNIINLEGNYAVRNSLKFENGLDDFQIFVNNYLFALEKNGDLNKALEVVSFVIKKYPTLKYYTKLNQSFISKIETNKGADEIIRRLFKPKKPFEISNFQSIKILSKEKSLEDMIVEQIKYGINVFGKELEIYQDNHIYGRQYRIPEVNGILDLLLIEKSTNQLYIVELKRNEAGIEVVNQIENYISALSYQLDRSIKGIICLHKPNQQLQDLVKTKNNIELFTYKFEFNQLG